MSYCPILQSVSISTILNNNWARAYRFYSMCRNRASISNEIIV